MTTANKALAALFLCLWAGLTFISLQLSTPCPTEDAVMCTWNADTQGNGTGHSFISLTEQLKLETK